MFGLLCLLSVTVQLLDFVAIRKPENGPNDQTEAASLKRNS